MVEDYVEVRQASEKIYAIQPLPLKIQVMYHEGAHKLESHGNWIDLATSEEYHLNPGDFKILSTGISMKMPDGYEGYVVARSSTFKKYGIIQTNCFGM